MHKFIYILFYQCMNIIKLGKIVVYGGTAQINLDLVPSSIATKSKTRFEQNKKKGKNNSIREKEISEVYISFSFTELLLFSVQFVDYPFECSFKCNSCRLC